jgi:glutamate synthase (ferredoxin)
VAIGCDMARQCHLNTCPTGIATQRPELRAKFRGKPEHIVRFFTELAEDLRHLLARYGLRSIEEAIGRTDLLEQVRTDGGLDLKPVLAASPDGTRMWKGGPNLQPVDEAPLDESWVEPAMAAIAEGKAFRFEGPIANKDRAIGARLAGEIAVLRAQAATPVDVDITLNGTAGQSFGAFLVEGMRLELNGQANDFVGKGLSGGEIVIRALGNAARNSGQHVILGNVALYGATAGKLYAAGRGGERFAVRNSGVSAVIEGVGDHGCEYMTGGQVVVLGRAGINFAAGMTGGLAWVYDEDGTFVSEGRFHPEFVEAAGFASCDVEAQEALKSVLVQHAEVACSGLAAGMLGDWARMSAGFVRLTPKPQV